MTSGLELDELVEARVTVYPNPTSENANVAITLTKSEEVKLELINALGQTVYFNSSKMSVGQNRVKLPVANLSGGMYFLNLTNGDEVIVKKLNLMK